MAFTPRALSDGQLPNSIGVIFTATADIATYVKTVSLFNTNVTQQIIDLYVNRSGVNRQWRRIQLDQYESAEALTNGDSKLLEAGDTLLAVTTTASAVDYTVDGVEETS